MSLRWNSSRRLAAVACACALLGAATCSPAAAGQRSNIVLLMGDDHGWDEDGYNGHPHLKTPVLDEMAAAGLRLDRFYDPLHRSGRAVRGGVRVPGIIEWPAGFSEPRATGVSAVTSDVLPTLCDLAGLLLPVRPPDGISLKPLIDGTLSERPAPICFWSFDTSREDQQDLKPYIDPRLQAGTTPLVKLLDGRPTRRFRNLQHPRIAEQDFAGPRAILAGRYKLVVAAKPGEDSAGELFDLKNDPAEQHNLLETHAEIAEKLQQQLRTWQQSVLDSLTGADYRQR